MQIIPDVYLVNGAPYGQHQNGYVVRLGDTYVMIDSGDLDHPTIDLVVANSARWGIDMRILITRVTLHACAGAARGLSPIAMVLKRWRRAMTGVSDTPFTASLSRVPLTGL